MHICESREDGYINYPGYTKFPIIIGHEFSGIVVERGGKVKDLDIGDMIVGDNMIWCGKCVACRSGYPNHCKNLEEFGFTVNGAFAEYAAIDAKCCWKINILKGAYNDEEKAYEIGAVIEPTSVAYNAMFIKAGGFNPGAYISVFGTGPVGLAAITLAKTSGAAKVIVFDINKKRAELAKKIGADYVFNPIELIKNQSSPSKRILEITNGEGIDMQIEATGAGDKIFVEIEKSLAIGGKIVQIGRNVNKVPLSFERIQNRGGIIFGALGHAGHGTYPNVIRLMASRKIDMEKVITARYKLYDMPKIIIKPNIRNEGKILIKPNLE